MAFTRAAGKHRRPSVLSRKSANIAGVAALTTTGVIGTLAPQAIAAEHDLAAEDTGTIRAVVMENTVTETLTAQVEAQATAQKKAYDKAEAVRKAEEARKAEVKRKAEAKAKKEREERERAAREAERKRLNAFRLPVAGSYVSTGYQSGGAMWSSGSHSGVDFHASSGSSVVAVGAGTVVEAGWGGAYGNNIVIRMNDGSYTQYGHLSSIGVSVGQSVAAGEQIALSGSTGNSTGPHLHFEARTSPEYGSDIDPVAYLRGHGVSV
ncbi:peptidoglycan DD-metalloendopeptidase family protein [Streptomyces sp. NPDC048442]|uniref:M23 family metallopeptidase n=1 Tax=Streptomyces sp. NPDC048442 TaxID=3154823 RepID=UPI0034345A79